MSRAGDSVPPHTRQGERRNDHQIKQSERARFSDNLQQHSANESSCDITMYILQQMQIKHQSIIIMNF